MFSYKAKPRQMMSGSDCAVLGISVGQEYHEGDKFGAALEFAHNRFDRVVVAVSDASQRYKMAIDGTPLELADKIATAAGSAWILRQTDALDEYKPEITRWNDWRFHPECQALQDEYRVSIEENSDLAASVEQDIDRFLAKKSPNVSLALAREYCRAFLIEELAVHTLQAKAYGGVRLYPGQQLHTKQLIRENTALPVPDGLNRQRFQSIRLVRRNGLFMPQAA